MSQEAQNLGYNTYEMINMLTKIYAKLNDTSLKRRITRNKNHLADHISKTLLDSDIDYSHEDEEEDGKLTLSPPTIQNDT